MCVQSQGSELTAITETRWDSSCGWNGVTKGHTLLRRDRPGALRGGFDLYMRQHLARAEFCLGVGDERGENLWVRTKELAGKSDTGATVEFCEFCVGVCSRPPEQDEW